MSEADDNAAMERVLTELVTAVAGDELGEQHVTAIYILAAAAGQIAQLAAVRQRTASGLPLTDSEVLTVQTRDGRHYVFGDLVSRALIGTPDDPGVLILLARLDDGLLDQARVGEMVGRAAATVGAADYGVPQVNFILLATLDEAVPQFRKLIPVFEAARVPVQLWPRFSALAARHAILVAEAGSAPFAWPSGMERLRMVDLAIDAAVCGSHVDLQDLVAAG